MPDPAALARLGQYGAARPTYAQLRQGPPPRRPTVAPRLVLPTAAARPVTAPPGRPTYAQLRAGGKPNEVRNALYSGFGPNVGESGPRRGILGQFRDVITGLPAGVGHIASSALRSAASFPQLVTGRNWRGEQVGRGDIADIQTAGLFTPGARPEGFEAANPLAAEIGSSFHRTAMDVRHPTQYARAAQRGEIVGKLLEDIANASIVASAGAGALGAGAESAAAAGNVERAAALGRAAATTERVAKLGGRVASTPFAPYEAGGSLLRKGTEALQLRGLPALGERYPTLAARAPTFFTEAGVAGRRGAARAELVGQRENAVLHRIGRDIEATGVTGDEAAAAYAMITGQEAMGPVLARRGVVGEEAGGVLAPSKIPGTHLTDEAARIATEAAADPAAHPRVTELVDRLRQVRDVETARAVEGGVSWADRADEYAHSNEVLTEVRDRFNAEWDRRIKMGDATPEMRDEAWAELEQTPSSYASRWRPRLREAQSARQKLLARGETEAADSIPTTPAGLAAEGVNPEYLPHGRPRSTFPAKERLKYRAPAEGVLGDIRLSSEHFREAVPEAPMNIPDLFQRWGEEARNLELRNFHREYLGRYGKRAGEVLGPDALAEIEARARQTAADWHPEGVTDKGGLVGQANAEFQRLRGEGIRDAMAERGLEAWPETGMASRAVEVDEFAGAPYLPAGLRQRLAKQWTVPKDLPFGLKQLEAINRKFKGAVLPWSIRWQVGDATSNALLGWVAGDVNLVDQVASMRRLKNLSPAERELVATHAPASGLTFGEDLSLRPEEAARPEVTLAGVRAAPREALRHPIRTLQAPGFKLNQAINRVQRQAFTLEHLDRTLTREGITLEEAAAHPEIPAVRKALRDSVDRADYALGAYDNLSPFEKRYMRQVFPFWSWIRTITKISKNLAIDDPLRAVWVMRVGQLGSDPHSELPDYLRGSFGTPLGRVETNFLNPFADPTAQSILTPEGALRSLSPGLKLGAVAAGYDPNRSLLPISRPPGTGRLDQFGREIPTPLALRPFELGYWLTQQTPQGRAAVNLAPQWNVGGVALGPVSRYKQGSLAGRGGRPYEVTPRLQELQRLVSIPIPTPESDVTSIVATARRRKAAGG